MSIAIFANKSFQVSGRKVYTYSDFNTSTSLQTEAQDVAGKKPSTYIKGPGLDPLGFTIPLKAELGHDVLKEYEGWKALTEAGKPYYLFIGGKPFSKNYWILKSVSMNNVVQDAKGKFLSAVLQLQFEEYVRAGKAQPKTSSSAAPGVPVDTSNLVSPVASTDYTPEEKSEMKRMTSGFKERKISGFTDRM